MPGNVEVGASPYKAEALLVTETPDDWVQPQGSAFQGLLVKRPFHGKWESLARYIDAVATKFDRARHPHVEVANGPGLIDRLSYCISQLLRQYELPASLSKQIHELRLSTNRARWIAQWVAADWNKWYRLTAADQQLWVEYDNGDLEHKMAQLLARQQPRFPGAAQSLASELWPGCRMDRRR